MGTSVSAIIQVKTLPLPTVPGPFSASVSAITPTTLTLNWTVPSGTGPFSYQAQRSLSGPPVWSNVGAPIAETTLGVTGLAENTSYQFQVIATSLAGTSTCPAVPATTLSVLPSAPIGLSGFGSPGANDIAIQWSSPTVGTPPFSYTVFYRVTGTIPYSPGPVVSPTSATSINVDVSGLAAGSTYDFQVFAANGAGTGPAATVSGLSTVATAPGQATALVASSVTATTLTLSWTPPTTGTPPFTYQVQQSSGGSQFLNIGGSVSGPPTSLTGLTANTAYQFRVITINASGSSTSAAISQSTPSVLPSAPTGLAVSGTPGPNDIAILWTAPATGTPPFTYQTSYRTPTGSGSFTPGPSTSNTTVDITGLTQSSSYDIQVTASNGAGTGPAATLTNVSTSTPLVLPSAPANISAGTVTTTSVQVNWTAPSSGTTPFTYRLQWRPTGVGSYTQLAPVSALTNTVNGLTASTTYDFQVFAINSAGNGPVSATLTQATAASPVVIPGAPTGVTSSAVGSTTVTLTWTAPAVGTPPLSYFLQSSLTGTGTWVDGPTVSQTTGQITSLTASTVYDFRVFASNSAGQGTASTTYTVSTTPSAGVVTWQPTGKSANIALTNGNLTATAGGSATAGSSPQTVVSTSALLTGKVSFEITMTTLTQNVRLGGVSSAYVFGSSAGIGSNTAGIGFHPSTGTGSPPAQTIFYNNVQVLTPPGNAPASDSNGATLTFCLDLDANLIWVTGPSMRSSYGPVAWNDSATADPGAGTGGVSLGSLTGNVFICFDTGEAGGIAILNAGATAYSFAVPAQFTSWQGGAVVVTIPNAVTGLAAGTPATTSVTLTWVAPSTGSRPFTYHVQQAPHSGTFAEITTTLQNTLLVTGLSNATSYDFRIFASNAAGNGGVSNVVNVVTALALPGAPLGVSLSNATNSTITVTWQAPSTGGVPASYQVQFKRRVDASFGNFGAGTAGLSQTVSGLTAGTLYDFQVFASNATGNGPVSAPVVSLSTTSTSANNTVVLAGSGGQINDSVGNVWTINSANNNSVFRNGAAAGTSSFVTEIAYVLGFVWQENTANTWWYWDVATSTWLPAAGTTISPLPSPNNTEIFSPSTAAITDSNGRAWTIVGGQVSVAETVYGASVVDGTTSGVVEIAYVNNQVWQFNGSLWWFKNVPSDTWSPVGGTPTSPLPAPPAPTGVAGTAQARKQNPRETFTDSNNISWGISCDCKILFGTAAAVLAGTATLDTSTSKVVRAVISSNTIYHLNSSGSWFSKASSASPAIGGWGAAITPIPTGQTERARDITNAFGINALTWGGATIAQYQNALTFLRFKRVRIAATSNGTVEFANMGIKMCLLLWGGTASDANAQTTAANLMNTTIIQLGSGPVMCWEGPNEPMGQSGNTTAATRFMDQGLANAADARVATKFIIPKMSFSNWLSSGDPFAYATGVGDESAFINWGNLHYYTNVANDERQPMSITSGTLSYGLVAVINGFVNPVVPGQPWCLTEAGTGAPGDTNAGLYSRSTGRAGGMMWLNYALDTYRLGGSCYFFFNVFDETGEGFRCFDKANTGNPPGPTQQANIARNFMLLMEDLGAAAETFVPGIINATISGLPPSGVNQAWAIQYMKTNGRVGFIVWNEPQVQDTSQPLPNDIFPAATTFTITISDGSSYSSSATYDPATGTAAIASTLQRTAGQTVQGNVAGGPIIVEFIP